MKIIMNYDIYNNIINFHNFYSLKIISHNNNITFILFIDKQDENNTISITPKNILIQEPKNIEITTLNKLEIEENDIIIEYNNDNVFFNNQIITADINTYKENKITTDNLLTFNKDNLNEILNKTNYIIKKKTDEIHKYLIINTLEDKTEYIVTNTYELVLITTKQIANKILPLPLYIPLNISLILEKILKTYKIIDDIKLNINENILEFIIKTQNYDFKITNTRPESREYFMEVVYSLFENHDPFIHINKTHLLETIKKFKDKEYIYFKKENQEIIVGFGNRKEKIPAKIIKDIEFNSNFNTKYLIETLKRIKNKDLQLYIPQKENKGDFLMIKTDNFIYIIAQLFTNS